MRRRLPHAKRHTTCFETFGNERFCSFPHRRHARREPENRDCKKPKPKYKSQEPTPTAPTASSPFCATTTQSKICQTQLCQDLSFRLFDSHSLRAKIDSGNSIFRVKKVQTYIKDLHVSKVSLDKSHETSDVQNVLVSGLQIPRSTNPQTN